MTYAMKVVVGFRGQKRCERAWLLGGCSSEKVGWRDGEEVKKKGSGSETIFDCVAFSLSRLFRDEHRQCSTQRRWFFRRGFLKKGRVFLYPFSVSRYASSLRSPLPLSCVSSAILVRLHLSVEIENATKTRLQSVNITSSGSCLVLFPTLGQSFVRPAFISTPNREISRTDEI